MAVNLVVECDGDSDRTSLTAGFDVLTASPGDDVAMSSPSASAARFVVSNKLSAQNVYETK